MSDYAQVPLVLAEIAELLDNGDAARWARDCGWIPGSGYCNNRDCDSACPFRAQLMADLARVIRSRLRRRHTGRPAGSRRSCNLLLLFSICELIALA